MLTAILLHVLRTGLVLAALALVARALRRAPARSLHRLWWLGFLQLAIPAGWLAERLLPATTRDAVALPTAWSLATSVTTAATTAGPDGPPWILLAWGLGSALLLSRLALDVMRARSLRRRSRPADGRLAAVAETAGLEPGCVRRCDATALPAVAGLRAPVILVPGHLIHALAEHELAAVLRHEEAHRRRRDPLRFALARVQRALIWWHPGAWWTLRRLETTAEFACDEAAAPDLVAGEHLADALARSLRLALNRPHVALPASLAGGHVPLRRRLRRLTLNRRSPSMSTIRLLTVLAVLTVGAGVLLAVPAPPAPPAPPAEPVPLSDVAPVAAPKAPAVVKPTSVPAPELAPAKNKPAKAKPSTAPKPPRQKLDAQPVLIHFTAPEYPKSAHADGAEGTVKVLVHVDAQGNVMEVLESKSQDDEDPRLVQAAMAAARTCRFEPARKDGEPVASTAILPFKFVKD